MTINLRIMELGHLIQVKQRALDHGEKRLADEVDKELARREKKDQREQKAKFLVGCADAGVVFTNSEQFLDE
jgi:hypothetical protein